MKKKTESAKKTYSRRAFVVWAALVVAAVLVLSAPMAQARKKHHRPPALNTVQCPNQGDSVTCNGTAGNDHLIGRAGTSDDIFGKEGNDVYEGKGGGDLLVDSSTTSNDT